MSPNEILEIIKAFFEAIKGVLKALGIMKDDEAADTSADA